MRVEYLAREDPVVLAGVSITPIVRISARYVEIKGTWSFYAVKQPVYLVILSAGGERAYTVKGQDVPITKVIEECPELAADR